MIRTRPPSDRYRDEWDRIFGDEPEQRSPDAIEVRIRTWGWFCSVCQSTVFDPENHQFHAVVEVP